MPHARPGLCSRRAGGLVPQASSSGSSRSTVRRAGEGAARHLPGCDWCGSTLAPIPRPTPSSCPVGAARWPTDVADLQVFRGSERGDSNTGPPPYHGEEGDLLPRSSMPLVKRHWPGLRKRRPRCGSCSMRADPGGFGPKRTSGGQPGERSNVPIAGRTAPFTREAHSRDARRDRRSHGEAVLLLDGVGAIDRRPGLRTRRRRGQAYSGISNRHSASCHRLGRTSKP